jgi:hypothetical protein
LRHYNTEKVKHRNADYHRIVRTMFAPRGKEEGSPSAASSESTSFKASSKSTVGLCS